MIKTESKTIEGTTYDVSQLDASTGSKMLVRLGKLIGPVLIELAKGNEADLGAALANISDADLDIINDTFAKATVVHLGGDQAPQLSRVFATHFAGNYGAMFEWLKFSVEVNYGNFLGGVLAKMKLASAAKSKPESVGTAVTSS